MFFFPLSLSEMICVTRVQSAVHDTRFIRGSRNRTEHAVLKNNSFLDQSYDRLTLTVTHLEKTVKGRFDVNMTSPRPRLALWLFKSGIDSDSDSRVDPT